MKFCVGDTIKVSQTIKEGEKNSYSGFPGYRYCDPWRWSGARVTSFVRLPSVAVGCREDLPHQHPLQLPGIEIIKKGKVRRAKLYYLRNLLGKKATKIKDVFVRKQSASIEVPFEVAKSEGTAKEENVRPEPIKVKNAPKVEVVKKESPESQQSQKDRPQGKSFRPLKKLKSKKTRATGFFVIL